MEHVKAEAIRTIVVLSISILIFCTKANPASFNLPFHEQLNPLLLKQMFNLDAYDKVPDYEVVQPRILSKRNDEKIRVHLSAFGEDISLRLQRNDDFNYENVKLFLADNTGDDMKLTEVVCEDNPGTLYQDPIQMAAVTISYKSDGKLQLEGTIGDDLVIKPMPKEVEFLSDIIDRNPEVENKSRIHNFSERFLKSFGYSSANARSGIHLIYRRQMKSNATFKNFMPLKDEPRDVNISNAKRFRFKKSIHTIQAWPEVLLVVDSESYNWHVSHGLNDDQMRRYYVSFLNGVDLRFKAISNPKISLVLSQIIIYKSIDATPYIKDNLRPLFPNVFDASAAIDHMSRYFYLAKQQKKVLREFDVVFLLTKLDMCMPSGVFCPNETFGLAFFQGACTVKEEGWMGVAMAEDNGGFDGILTAAHEIAHLLGAEHDDERGILEAYACHLDDGFIMSNEITSDRIFQWSSCSIAQMERFLKSKKAQCLFNKPTYQNELEKSELPGNILSLDEQCKRVWGTLACAHDSRVCTSLRCYRPPRFHPRKPLTCSPGLAPAAEGSSCGKDLHCRHGKCVSTSLVYSPAWNMKPVKEEDNILKLLINRSTTEEPPSTLGCFYHESFCDHYFCTIERDLACQNIRITEECSDYGSFCSKP